MARGFIDGEYEDGEIRGCMFLAGIRGMGKTTEMARLLSLCAGGVIFFDSLSKHGAVLSGYRTISQPGELKEYLRLNHQRRFQVLYQPREGDLDAHFQAVCIIVRAFGWMVLATDELDMLTGQRWGDRRMPPEFYHLVNYGRHSCVSLLATARYPASVPRGFTSQCQEMRLFSMSEPSHVKYFEEYIGQANAAQLSSLAKFQYLRWVQGMPATLSGGRNF